MKKLLITGVALSALIGTPAFAADMAIKASPPPAPFFSWTGFYVGGNTGYGWQQIIEPPSTGQISGPKPNGGFWGGQIGGNYQLGPNWLVGVEFDGSVARIENSVLQPDPLVPTTLLAFTDKVNSLMSVRARLGFVSDRNLFYVSGGPGWIRSQLNSANAGPAAFPSPRFVTDHQTENGWTVGAGFERVLWSNWTGRIEYQYFHSDPFTVTSLGGPMPGVRANLQSVSVGVNYLFQ
jgi:outer membrane immunogenic protein